MHEAQANLETEARGARQAVRAEVNTAARGQTGELVGTMVSDLAAQNVKGAQHATLPQPY